MSRYQSTSSLFQPCEKQRGQTSLPDHRLLKGDLLAAVIQTFQESKRQNDGLNLKGDLLAAVIQTLKAQTALMDALYVLESQLEAALDSDEEGGR